MAWITIIFGHLEPACFAFPVKRLLAKDKTNSEAVEDFKPLLPIRVHWPRDAPLAVSEITRHESSPSSTPTGGPLLPSPSEWWHFAMVSRSSAVRGFLSHSCPHEPHKMCYVLCAIVTQDHIFSLIIPRILELTIMSTILLNSALRYWKLSNLSKSKPWKKNLLKLNI